MTQVALKSVNKSFGSAQVIRDVDLEINKGEFVVFVGPSGCGKSTLLRLIAGLETLTDGTIEIAGRPVMDLPPSKRGIAMVFQSYALYPHMTVFNNMAFSLDIQRFSKAEIAQKVNAAAKILQMEHLLVRRPAALSGGQRQRVAIGRAIVRDPDVFLFDEPLSNLDAALRHDTRVEIAKLHRQLGATTIYVTHDQVEAMTLADKIVVLKDGEVMQVGAPMQLFNEPANEFVAGFLGSPSINFFDGEITDVASGSETASFKGEGLDLTGVRFVSKDKTAGQAARLGIRPQHLILDTNGSLKGEITLVERLGTETVAELI
ncbi:MAG: ABC transporter ATP-binding protein, partial [Rhodobacteraceae bacterium]|nr:ABC transporter ATP-binding protein [Paracoccaceae bacterium]